MPDTKFWKLGLLGWPLGYSLSPLMHQAALKAAGLKGEYQEYAVGPDGVWDWLAQVEEQGLDGFNVTMPYKRSVFTWLLTEGRFGSPEREETIGAVNTVALRDGEPVGYNTDGEGFLHTLVDPPRSLRLDGWRVILLGAGGAAQAIAATLAMETKVARLTVWNRHAAAAEALVSKVSALRASTNGNFGEVVEDQRSLPIRECQLLVNATPVGMKGKREDLVDFSQLHEGQVVYDLVYEPRETLLICAARERGCQAITGDEMLAGQGAAAFEIWTGVEGMLPVMRRVLNERFSAGD